MQTDQNPKSFFFEENPVGYFEDDRLPCSPGCYRYMPYRGPGHHRLQGSRKTKAPQRCHYITENTKRYFTVLACPPSKQSANERERRNRPCKSDYVQFFKFH
jgi:hypothetical protein